MAAKLKAKTEELLGASGTPPDNDCHEVDSCQTLRYMDDKTKDKYN